jgi:diadenosine tetraphosphate (Ap4A) HIT family hydrolase
VRFLRTLAATVLLLLPLGRADVRGCACDVSKPETMAADECQLCRLAEAQPAEPQFFFIKDANPTKPNRWLVLPRFHGASPQELAGMTAAERTAYWTAAIAKARELWGNQWGLAMNGLERRTQCHAHIHIGKLLDGVENDRFVVVDSPADIPVPRDGTGVWVHPVGNKLHAHLGDQAAELVLER